MKLLVDLPPGWTPTPAGALVAPGISLRIDELRPLPYDLEGWRDVTLARGVDRSALRLVAAVDRHTPQGWPVALVVSDVGSLRRMHAFYRFLVHGCVAVAEGDAHAFDAVMDQVKEVLLAARPDFSTDAPIAVSEIFAGFGPDEKPLPEG